MKKVTTKSGATYFFDDDFTQFQRDTDVPMGGIPLDRGHIYRIAGTIEPPVVGAQMFLPVENGLLVRSTPVVSVEAVE